MEIIYAFAMFGLLSLVLFIFHPDLRKFVINFKSLKIELHKAEERLMEIKEIDERVTTISKYFVKFILADKKINKTLLIAPQDDIEKETAEEEMTGLVKILFQGDERQNILNKLNK